jgi:hypothetical protein
LSLPENAEPYLIAVTSRIVGTTLFAPRIVVFDATGKPLRSMAGDSFMFHGAALYLGIRAQPGERYLMVASEPRTVGQETSQLWAGTQTTVGVAAGVAYQVHTGFEKNANFTYAVNGQVTVAVQPMPKVN